MPNFIYDDTSPGALKADLVDLPIGADPTKWVSMADWNTFRQCLLDIQTWARAAIWVGSTPQTSDPAPGVTNYWWTKTDGTFNVRIGATNYPHVKQSRLVSAGVGLTGGGDLSNDRTFNLGNTAVTPGSYKSANITVDQQGRITAAASGALTTQIAVAHLDSGTGLFTKQTGFTGTPVKNGTGDWTLNYTTSLNTDNGIIHLTIQDQGGAGTRMNITAQSVDTNHIRVRTFSNGSPSDQHFWITISSIN